RGGRHERAAPVVGAIRADRLPDRAAEDADAGPHAPLAAPDGARVRRALWAVRRGDVELPPAPTVRRARGPPDVNWRIRLTRWDAALLVIMAIGAIMAVVRYAGGIGSVANINNAYPWGWWVGYGIMTTIALGGVGFTITGLVEV